MGSTRQRMNHDRFDSRERTWAHLSASAVIIVNSLAVGSAGLP
jgi:hypothetical protein